MIFKKKNRKTNEDDYPRIKADAHIRLNFFLVAILFNGWPSRASLLQQPRNEGDELNRQTSENATCVQQLQSKS